MQFHTVGVFVADVSVKSLKLNKMVTAVKYCTFMLIIMTLYAEPFEYGYFPQTKTVFVVPVFKFATLHLFR